MIVIIDYGMGNLRSVQKAFERIKTAATISNDRSVIEGAHKLVLPGVGHFANGMEKLQTLGLLDVLNYKALDQRIPILGICLGMQLFTRFSEEGDAAGLGWIPATTKRFNFNGASVKLKVPHIGWNSMRVQKPCALLKNSEANDMFYFVHSYFVDCKHRDDVLCKSVYGIEFDSVVHHENILGMQFHPEKSYRSGLNLIRNFVDI
ncbi:MAG: imidazole glycerol phosphate synthase subunit HisH [Bacteroidetes bacterium]|nr:imidazole glycerol phosphate synthase subunit HisH [Bacteroidota bacterium]